MIYIDFRLKNYNVLFKKSRELATRLKNFQISISKSIKTIVEQNWVNKKKSSK